MGSGLILLVIVAAWLAVLVPMALRSHDSSTSLASVDRFSDAMRVLSRRDAAARARARREVDDDPLSAAAYAQGGDDDEWDDEWDGGGSVWRERVVGWRARAADLRRERGAGSVSSPAARRRRVLLTLLALTVGCLVGGFVGPRFLLPVGVVLLAAVALFVVQLRRLALARAGRVVATAPARRPVSVPASASVRVQPASVPVQADVPSLADHDPVADVEPAVASTPVRHDDPLPADPLPADPLPAEPAHAAPAAALGASWSPVPIPPPTYVTAAVAPARAQRIVDLTRPGAWSPPKTSRPAEEPPGTAAPAESPAERRRAVNDW